MRGEARHSDPPTAADCACVPGRDALTQIKDRNGLGQTVGSRIAGVPVKQL
jgi:hypothetical protein